MTLFPFKHIEFESPLQISEVEDAIKENIVWTKQFGNVFSKNTNKKYEGFIENKTIKIRRILKWGQNSFIPIVTGKVIESKSEGSKIKVKIQLHKVIKTLLVFLTLLPLSLMITEIFNQPLHDESLNHLLKQHNIESIDVLNNSKSFNWMNLLFLIMPFLITTIVFNYESSKVEFDLKKILKVK